MKKDFITDSIFDFQKLLKAQVEYSFKHLNIGFGQLQILMKLYEHDNGIISQTEITKSLGIDKSNASRNISKLERKGLINILQINDRNKGIELTKVSIELKEKVIMQLQQISTRMLKGINEEDFYIMQKVLAKMKENLK